MFFNIFPKTIFLLTIPSPFGAKFVCTLYGVLWDDFHKKNFKILLQNKLHFISLHLFFSVLLLLQRS